MTQKVTCQPAGQTVKIQIREDLFLGVTYRITAHARCVRCDWVETKRIPIWSRLGALSSQLALWDKCSKHECSTAF